MTPNRLVMRPGDVTRLTLTTRSQRSLTKLLFWADVGNGSEGVPISVDNVGAVTALAPGRAAVNLFVTADGTDTTATVPVVVRGIRFDLDTIRVFLTPNGPFVRDVAPAGAVVDTAAVPQTVRWTVEDSSVARITPNTSIYYAGFYVVTPRRVGVTRLVVTSTAVPSLTAAAPVVVRYCLRLGGPRNYGVCEQEGTPP